MLMAAVSAIMGIREHKYAFQNLSNEHEGAARFSLVAYAGMIVAAALTMKSWGVDAFMIAWLAAELAIAVYVIAQNRKLFPVEFRPSLAPLPRIAIVLVLAFAAAAWPARHDGGWSLTRVVLVAIAGAAVLSLVSFFIFGLRNVQDVFVSRFRRRFAPSA
jgi:hypothetical protein